jgi:hypothetical protein
MVWAGAVSAEAKPKSQRNHAPGPEMHTFLARPVSGRDLRAALVEG